MARISAPFDSLPTGKPSRAQSPALAIPAELEEWLADALKQIPKTLHRHARRRFAEVGDWCHAMNLLTDTIATLTAKTTPAAAEVGIDAQDGRIKHYANAYANTSTAHAKTENTKTVFEAMKTTPALHNEHVINWRNAQEAQNTQMLGVYIHTKAEAGYWLHDAHIIAWHNTTATQRALTYAEEKLGHPIQGDTVASQLARIQDPAFWRREIRKALRPWRELWHLALAPHYIKYASTEAVNEYESMLENGKKWAETHEMTAPDGRKCPLPTPEETARNRHAQLVAFTKGMENLAGETGMTAQIITLTLDSQYHSAKDKYKNGPRVPNEKYNSALTPETGHSLLNKSWARLRSALKRRKIEFYWVLGAQPNKDETPHWHIVMWSHNGDKAEIETLIYKYFKTNDSNRQIDIQSAKSEMGASSYAMRMLAYITRQTDTIDDHTDADAQEAQAASAWASTWGVRRYRTSHTGATLWKMARNDDLKPKPDQKPLPADLKKAAQDGDFALFYKLKKEYQCKILYVEKMGKYGDSYKSPRGIEYTCAETGEISSSWKQTDWKLTGLPEKPQQNQEAYSYSKEPRQGASAPQDTPDPPNSAPLDHWTEPERAEWAEHLAYRQTQQDAKLAKTA